MNLLQTWLAERQHKQWHESDMRNDVPFKEIHKATYHLLYLQPQLREIQWNTGITWQDENTWTILFLSLDKYRTCCAVGQENNPCLELINTS